MGHYLIATLGNFTELFVSVLTRNTDAFEHTITSINTHTSEKTVGYLHKVSSLPEEVIPDADMLIFTIPSNSYSFWLELVSPYIACGTILVFIPGTGGCEFLTKDLVKSKKCILCGTQRVPSGTKLIQRGSLVHSLGSRKDLRLASIPACYTKELCNFFGHYLAIKTIALPTYLSVTLTPSNAILHTSRLYGLFHNYSDSNEYATCLSFYRQWDIFSSDILLGCDSELQQCLKKLDCDVFGIKALKEHYEIAGELGVSDSEKMTNKIRALDFLKDAVPMYKTARGTFKPDFASRYFLEDFPYGLCIIKGFCDICAVDTPYMNRILHWYSQLFSLEYFDANGNFLGKDLQSLPLPQNYGIQTIKAIHQFYSPLSPLQQLPRQL